MSVELVEVQIPFAGITAIEVEVVNSVGATGPPGTPYTEPTDTPPTDLTMIWVTLAGVRCTYYNGSWVAIPAGQSGITIIDGGFPDSTYSTAPTIDGGTP